MTVTETIPEVVAEEIPKKKHTRKIREPVSKTPENTPQLKVKKERSERQKASFQKARLALAEKRERIRKEKEAIKV